MHMLQYIPWPGIQRRLRGSRVSLVGLALVAVALQYGCATAPAKSESMLDPQADFGSYKTFGWHTDPGADGSTEPVSLVDAHIRAAIASEMQRKGYAEAPAGSAADLNIAYEAVRAEKVKSNPFRIGVGVGSYGSGGGGSVIAGSSSVKNVSEGSLVIHVIDRERNAEVWRSRITRELGKGTVEPEVIQRVVAEVFTDFPARTAAP